MKKEEEMKELDWVASSKDDLLSLPSKIVSKMGFALHQAQKGLKSDHAKSFKGYSGASVLEIIEMDEGGTYRALYTVKFKEIIYVLHVFQKKSKSGIATPKQDVDPLKVD